MTVCSVIATVLFLSPIAMSPKISSKDVTRTRVRSCTKTPYLGCSLILSEDRRLPGGGAGK